MENEITLYKHYAVIDDKNNIIDYYCDAFPNKGDGIFVQEHKNKHVGQVYTLNNENGIYTHHVVDGKIEPKSDNEISAELAIQEAYEALIACDGGMSREGEDVVKSLLDMGAEVPEYRHDKYLDKKKKRDTYLALKNG